MYESSLGIGPFIDISLSPRLDNLDRNERCRAREDDGSIEDADRSGNIDELGVIDDQGAREAAVGRLGCADEYRRVGDDYIDDGLGTRRLNKFRYVSSPVLLQARDINTCVSTVRPPV